MSISFRLIKIIFHFFGMWPISSQVSNNKTTDSRFCNAFLIIWSLMNILPLSVCIILVCVYNEPILVKLKGYGSFSATSMGGIVLVTHLIILLESLFTRNGQDLLWNKAKCVDRTFEKMGIATDQHRNQFYKNFSLKFFSYQLLAWISEITVLFLIQDDLSWKLFNYATLFSVMVSRSRHLHHALYIGGLRWMFRFNMMLTNLILIGRFADIRFPCY